MDFPLLKITYIDKKSDRIIEIGKFTPFILEKADVERYLYKLERLMGKKYFEDMKKLDKLEGLNNERNK